MTFRPAGLDRTLWPAVLLFAAAFGLFEFTNIDLWLQDHFYNATTRRWLVDEDNALGRLIFYNGPKALIIPTAVAVLVLALGPARWRDKLRFARRDLWVALLVLVTVPALAGWGKSVSNAFCPSEIRRYGGDVPYVKLCEPYPANDRPERRGHCFPAGHASGGFALLGLMWLRRTRAWKMGGLALGLGLGWWMGGYQMLKGAHYLSHTVTTMFGAWIVMLVWRRVIRPAPDDGGLRPEA
jgi:membrane-associated PAP2 superfamily phosphatase